MANMLPVAFTVIALMCKASAAEIDSLRADHAVHPYFSSVAHYAFEKDRAIVTLDNYRLPHLVEARVNGAVKLPEAVSLTFVLIVPDSGAEVVSVGGVDFPAPMRPYYMAATELSNAQYAALGNVTGSYADYEVAAQTALWATARLNPEVEVKWLDPVMQHLSDPDKPALTMGLGEAVLVSQRLSVRNTLSVRLPTIAEWTIAMRAGSSDRFWWGNQLDTTRITRHESSSSHVHELELFQRVDEGAANPLGLKHTIGNASELVFPTPDERKALQRHFGPFAVDPREDRHTLAGLQLTAHTALAMGGAAAWPKPEFSKSIDDWYFILPYEVAVNQGWGANALYMNGARFVIQLPDGEITISASTPISVESDSQDEQMGEPQ